MPSSDEVAEMLGDAAEVADAVTVGVRERPRVDLVDHRIPPPVGRLGDPRPGRGRRVWFFGHFGSKS